MKARRRIRALVALTMVVAFSARASESERSISDLVNDLARTQARMAAGDQSSYALSQERLHAIGAAIEAAKPEVWKDKTQTDAVAIYILSGGRPREVARLLERGAIPASQNPLLRGALAYASGRERDAAALLGDIDPNKVSLRLAGQLAYAQSVLKTASDPRRAIALLDLARVLSPGALVEEAALRREILLLGDQRDSDRVVLLSRQYVTRFGHSLYAENFIQGLAAATARFGLSDDVSGFRKFDELLVLLKPEQRRVFLLAVARSQTLNGKFDVAGAAAREALRDTPAGSGDEARARLFAAAAQIVTMDLDAGVAALGSVDRSRLDKPDQDLLAAVSYTAAHLRDIPSPAAFAEVEREDQVAAARSPAAVTSSGADAVSQTVKRAESVMERAAAIGGDEVAR
jgi:chemotaxis protein MotC